MGGSTQDGHDPADSTDSPGVLGLQVTGVCVKKGCTTTLYWLKPRQAEDAAAEQVAGP